MASHDPGMIRTIESIELEPEHFEEFRKFTENKELEPLRELKGLSAINVFVGANNSGKSRLLRALARMNTLAIRRRDFDATAMQTRYSSAVGPLESVMRDAKLSSICGVQLKDLEEARPLDWLTLSEIPLAKAAEVRNKLRDGPKNITFAQTSQTGDLQPGYADRADKTKRNLDELLQSVSMLPVARRFNRIYVPSLRGLRPFAGDDGYRDLFKERTHSDYFAHKDPPEIFTGIDIYLLVKDHLLSVREKRSLIADYEELVSTTFFRGEKFTLTPHDEETVLWIELGDVEKPIHDLGDGMQSLIMLTLHAYLHRDQPTLYFIEEPEIYLHPGLQRELLDFLSSLDNHLYFFTTHSNHLLDMSLDFDMSIYNLQRVQRSNPPCFEVRRVSSSDRRSLDLLGIRNSSVFLVNATIWIEGITERRYLREFLRIYEATLPKGHPRIREDVHFSFVEYSGSNITHWSFLDTDEAPIEVKTLCGRAFVLADADGIKLDSVGKKARRLQSLEGTLGLRFSTTAGREIENMLPWPVIKTVVSDYEEKDVSWCPDATRADYRDASLGGFVDDLLETNGLTSRRKSGYGEKSGTLKGKRTFCEKACGALRDVVWDELDDDVQALIGRLHAFVLEENGLASA